MILLNIPIWFNVIYSFVRPLLNEKMKAKMLFVTESQILKTLQEYIDDEFITDGLFNASKARPLVRLGYMNYGVVGEENTFTKNRPQLDKNGNLLEVNEWDGVYR